MAGGMITAARIECEKAEDRDALVVILAGKGEAEPEIYQVRLLRRILERGRGP